MKLEEILTGIEYSYCSSSSIFDLDIEKIAYNSKLACIASIFVCLFGKSLDGHKYARDAYNNGCRVFICEKEIDVPKEDSVILKVKDSRIALAIASSNFFCHPEKHLKIVGITGTKGKTSTSYETQLILNESGIKTGLIGTMGVYYGDAKVEDTINSTPESYELYRIFSKMLRDGISVVIMEVSSQAIFMNRVYGLNFDIGVFTNLYLDHVGESEHPTFDHYKNCKLAFFDNCKKAILNSDDEHFIEFKEKCSNFVTTSIKNTSATYCASSINYAEKSGKYYTSFMCHDVLFEAPLPGDFSVSNMIQAIAICSEFGVNTENIKKSFTTMSIPGRCQFVDNKKNYKVIIDYAHNGESLKSIINSLTKYKHEKLILIFGSVGERTQVRRKEMGLVANKYCDFAIITSDNPNKENPMDICNEIAQYIENKKCKVIVERKEAIEYALSICTENDILLLAGKGQEQYQLINNVKVPFSEEKIVSEFLK